LVNYGALTQTWEAPSHVSRDTGFGGDNDPIDVLEVFGGWVLGMGRFSTCIYYIRTYMIHSMTPSMR